jgi:hypothetical protein
MCITIINTRLCEKQLHHNFAQGALLVHCCCGCQGRVDLDTAVPLDTAHLCQTIQMPFVEALRCSSPLRSLPASRVSWRQPSVLLEGMATSICAHCPAPVPVRLLH